MTCSSSLGGHFLKNSASKKSARRACKMYPFHLTEICEPFRLVFYCWTDGRSRGWTFPIYGSVRRTEASKFICRLLSHFQHARTKTSRTNSHEADDGRTDRLSEKEPFVESRFERHLRKRNDGSFFLSLGSP